MKKYIKYIAALIIFLGLSTVGTQLMQAEETVPYSVKPILPNNQIDKELQYFDLKMKPGEEQTIEVAVSNSSNEEIELEMSTQTAITNVNGVIDYVTAEKETVFDPTLNHPFSTLASMAETITVPANETINVPVKINMPQEEVTGMILGGIKFTEKSSDTQEEASGGMAIRNKFAYIIAVKLTESDQPVAGDIQLNEIKADQVSYRNVISANLQNPEPALIKELAIEAEVTPAGSEKVLYKQNNQDFKLAPNSNFDYPIYLENQAFKAGKYTLHLVATSGEDKWTFTQDFEINKDEATRLNKESAVDVEEVVNWSFYMMLAGSILGAIVLGIIIWQVLRRRKQKQEIKQVSQKKRPRKNGKKAQAAPRKNKR